MSGNPFRRPNQRPNPSELLFDASVWEQPTTTTPPPTDVDKDATRRASKGKRVRIATPPPLSPDPATPGAEEAPIFQVSDERHTGSPPPDPDALGRTEFSPSVALANPFGPNILSEELHYDQEVLENTRRNSETSLTSQSPTSVNTGVFRNPFERTLATLEPTGDVDSQQEETSFSPEGSSSTEQKKAQIDVDSFKRLLLTGSKAPLPSANSDVTNASKSRAQFPSDIAVSNENASVSEGSLQDSSSESGSSPRASDYTATARPAEAIGLPNAGNDNKKKPPPPKSRHGKAVNQRNLPQVVSFTDFATTEVSPVVTEAAVSPSTRPPLPSIPDTASKPAISLTDPVLAPRETHAFLDQQEAVLDQTSSQIQPKKPSAPPPVPETRRPNRARTSSNLSDSSQRSSHNPGPTRFEESTIKTPSRAPPRPPPRRPNSGQAPSIASSTTSESLPQVGTSATVKPPSSQTSSPRVAPVGGRLDLPPPPPPPPPPPRKRGSGRSSIDIPAGERNMSLDSTGGLSTNSSIMEESTDFLPGPNKSSEISNGGGGPDMLADLDALQAQVDALRQSALNKP